MRLRLAMVGLVVAVGAVAAEQAPEQLPRFRSGASLVRVDAYFTKDGVPVTDLRPEDVEVVEDDRPQKIESFLLVTARPPIPQSARVDPTNVAQMRDAAADPSARLFTLFFDIKHVGVAGSYHAQNPIVETLDRVIGQDDLVGVMTPGISPGNITYSRRTTSIERFVRDSWAWGEKDRLSGLDPHEEGIMQCYGAAHLDIAEEMIARRREQQTLDAIDGLVTHLDGLRPERKFVIVFTEGWPLFQRSESLGRSLANTPPGRDRVAVGPGGRLTTGPDPQSGVSASYESCERERVMLAFIDHQIEFRELMQRANRANVSFYPVDTRGLVVFDEDINRARSISRMKSPAADQAGLRSKQDTLRTMAEQTDGQAVLDTNNVSAAMAKMLSDVGSYYLMSYYSTNPKLDGRFRRIGVRVKREGVEVRARPGYLAPTEAEGRAAGVAPSAPPGSRVAPVLPPAVSRALDAIAPGRGNLPVRIQASGGAGLVRAVVELDVATLKLPEWLAGGGLRLIIEPERGGSGQAYTLEAVFEPGQRSVTTVGPATALAPGRYSVRAEVKPTNGRLPMQVTTFATIPPESALVGTSALALRRGPSTGLAYRPTADPRFRRTERLRIEVPLLAEGLTPTGRVLTREGQPMALTVVVSERTDDTTRLKLAVAEVVLSALAEGEYVLELAFASGAKSEAVAYGFRLVP